MPKQGHERYVMELTAELLRGAAAGDRGAFDLLFPRLYQELKAAASSRLRKVRQRNSLHTTELVHEAYLRMADQNRVAWSDRSHFCAVAATIMRRILVDHARRKLRARRGGGAAPQRLPDIDVPAAVQREADLADLITLDAALGELKHLDERQARVVELRYFGGLSVEETASVLQVSPRTVKGDWRVARAWLKGHLEEEPDTSRGS